MNYDTLRLASSLGEIQLFIQQQFVIMGITLVLSVLVSVAAYLEQLRHAILLVPVLIITGVFGASRADLLMHRPAAYITAQEASATDQAVEIWEVWKAKSPATRALPLYDAVALLGYLWLFVDAQMRAWKYFGKRRLRWVYAVGTTILLGLSVASIPLAPKLAV